MDCNVYVCECLTNKKSFENDSGKMGNTKQSANRLEAVGTGVIAFYYFFTNARKAIFKRVKKTIDGDR